MHVCMCVPWCVRVRARVARMDPCCMGHGTWAVTARNGSPWREWTYLHRTWNVDSNGSPVARVDLPCARRATYVTHDLGCARRTYVAHDLGCAHGPFFSAPQRMDLRCGRRGPRSLHHERPTAGHTTRPPTTHPTPKRPTSHPTRPYSPTTQPSPNKSPAGGDLRRTNVTHDEYNRLRRAAQHMTWGGL